MSQQDFDGRASDTGDGSPRHRSQQANRPNLRGDDAGRADASLPRVPDGLWARLEPLIQRYDPPASVGRRRTNQRRVLDAILYRLVTGCPWNELPGTFPHPSAVYRTYRRWLRYRLMDEILQTIIASAQQARAGQGT